MSEFMQLVALALPFVFVTVMYALLLNHRYRLRCLKNPDSSPAPRYRVFTANRQSTPPPRSNDPSWTRDDDTRLLEALEQVSDQKQPQG